VSAVLGAINPRYAQAIRLRLLEGLERDDCARELGVTTPTFDVVLLRAVRAFRARWDDDFGEALS
jgi:DNA-directed RNA polymerase specialized sigma24 family protein